MLLTKDRKKRELNATSKTIYTSESGGVYLNVTFAL
jgi:hypothetical protein